MNGLEQGLLLIIPGLLIFLITAVYTFYVKELAVDREVELRNADVKEKFVMALRDKVEVRISTEDLKEFLK